MARDLDRLPELHRQRERQQHDQQRRVERRRERPGPVGEEGHRQDERGEVRAAARREARRARRARPGRGELARLGGRDRAVLGAVEAERAAAQQPEDEADRQGDRGRQAQRAREAGRSRTGATSAKASSARSRGRVTPRRRKTGDSAAASFARPRTSGILREDGRARGHLALAQRAVHAGERPEALADDHDAVRPRHPAELRDALGRVGAREHLPGLRHHTQLVGNEGRPAMGRAAYFTIS